jgi:hypothetical protein
VARGRDPGDRIAYRVADLSRPVPGDASCFDAVASYLVLNLNDVCDYRGFAATLAAVLRPGARLGLAFNDPYGAVIHKHLLD